MLKRINFLVLFLVLSFIACDRQVVTDSLNIGYEFHKQGKLEESIKEYEKGIATGSKNTELLLRYGNVLEDSGRLQDAKAQYQLLLKESPNHILGMVSLAMVFRKEKNFKEALQLMETAVKGKPESWMQDVLGNIYEEQGDLVKAREQYEKAVLDEPNEPEFLTDLANIKLKQGEPKLALEDYKKIYSLLEGLPEDIDTGTKDYTKQKVFAGDMIRLIEAQGIK